MPNNTWEASDLQNLMLKANNPSSSKDEEKRVKEEIKRLLEEKKARDSRPSRLVAEPNFSNDINAYSQGMNLGRQIASNVNNKATWDQLQLPNENKSPSEETPSAPTTEPTTPSSSLFNMVSNATKGVSFSPQQMGSSGGTKNPGNSSLLDEYAKKIREMMTDLKTEKENEDIETQFDRRRLNDEIQRRLDTPLARVDLSNIMGMIDAFTGSNLKSGYQKPAGMMELLQAKMDNTKSKFTAGKDYRKELLNALGLGTSLAKTQEDAETRRYVKELRANEESKASLSDLRLRQNKAYDNIVKTWDTSLINKPEQYATVSEVLDKKGYGSIGVDNFIKQKIENYFNAAVKAGVDPIDLPVVVNEKIQKDLAELRAEKNIKAK